ncbi:MAG: carbonic anhydrase [Candidatus Melainabacteria bacterium]|nr:carbonic anhydrase [Candidatus Melainabacteria bacterium]
MRFSILLSGFVLLMSAMPAHALTWEQALENLKQGNERYLQGITKYPRIDPIRRLRTATEGQTPVASVLSCADARVPVETAFDKGFGDLFVVRVAGNVCEMAELASIEYGALYLHTPLIVVLGHTQCGAVKAAISGGQDLKGTLPLLMDEIRPAVEAAKAKNTALTGDELEIAAIEENVRRSIAHTMKSPGIKSAVESKKVGIVGAIRDLKTGKIRWLK